MLEALLEGLQSLLLVALVVVMKVLRRRSWLAVVAAVLLWPLLCGIGGIAGFLTTLAVGTLSIFVLLRWGALALLATIVTSNLAWMARSTDWSEWHAQPATLAVTCVAWLAAYGWWAAVGRGRAAVGEEA